MDHAKPTVENVIGLIADIFARRGAESYLGEDVTMSAHMLQCAQLAEADGANDNLVTAALLHDIGHYTGEFPEDALEQGINNEHDTVGGRFLAPYFPVVVADCVRLHVAAKRYLCATDPAYAERLSDASVLTLGLQGGPMSADESAAFRAEPFHKQAIRVRLWDEAAKVPSRPTPDFAHYRPLLERIVARHSVAPG